MSFQVINKKSRSSAAQEDLIRKTCRHMLCVLCSQATGDDTFLRVRADEELRMQNLLRILPTLFAFFKHDLFIS